MSNTVTIIVQIGHRIRVLILPLALHHCNIVSDEGQHSTHIDPAKLTPMSQILGCTHTVIAVIVWIVLIRAMGCFYTVVIGLHTVI